MNIELKLSMGQKALKKLYPDWQLFIDELIDRLEPFYKGIQSKEEVHFIQLIGYGKRQKARDILTDLLELLDWQSESIFLWENWDVNAPSSFTQVVGFQQSYRKFPKVVLTDFLIEFFADAYSDFDKCEEFFRVEKFLSNRKELDFIRNENPSDAKGGLVISFLNSFGDSDHRRTRVIFQFLWKNPIQSIEELRVQLVPEALEQMIEKGYVRKGEQLFFSKDEPRHILLAFELLKVTQMIEIKGQELIGSPVSLTFDSMEYFLSYIIYKKLRFPQLHRTAWDFFLPVFRQFPRMTQKVSSKPESVELDFTGGWKFNVVV